MVRGISTCLIPLFLRTAQIHHSKYCCIIIYPKQPPLVCRPKCCKRASHQSIVAAEVEECHVHFQPLWVCVYHQEKVFPAQWTCINNMYPWLGLTVYILYQKVMYDSDSDASQLKMPKSSIFFLCLSESWLNQGKARWDFHGNLGLNFDLCRESMALESGNTGLNAILSEVTVLQFFWYSCDQWIVVSSHLTWQYLVWHLRTLTFHVCCVCMLCIVASLLLNCVCPWSLGR